MDRRRGKRWVNRILVRLMEREEKTFGQEYEACRLARGIVGVLWDPGWYKTYNGDWFYLASMLYHKQDQEEYRNTIEREALESEWNSAWRRERDALEQAEALRRREEVNRNLRTMPKQGTTGEGDLSGVLRPYEGGRPKKSGKVIPFKR